MFSSARQLRRVFRYKHAYGCDTFLPILFYLLFYQNTPYIIHQTSKKNTPLLTLCAIKALARRRRLQAHRHPNIVSCHSHPIYRTFIPQKFYLNNKTVVHRTAPTRSNIQRQCRVVQVEEGGINCRVGEIIFYTT